MTALSSIDFVYCLTGGIELLAERSQVKIMR
jgi:hypothetical protein